MFDIKEEMKNFKPIDMASLQQKLGQIPEDMRNAIELYNKALEDVAAQNEDMAIIALKKAIAIYPAFYEAMILMGVCYDSLGDEESARMMFNRVIEMDDNSIRALHYLDRLDGKEDGKISGNVRPKKRESNQLVSWISRGLSPEKTAPYYLKYVLGFVVGIIAMGVLWLLVPADKPLIHISPRVDGEQQIKVLKEDNERLNQIVNELTSSLETANQKENQLRDELVQYQEWSKTLRQLDKLASAGKYRDVILEIEKLDGLSIPSEIENEITLLYDECKTKAIGQIFETGRNLYNSNASQKSKDVYRQAADEFKLAIKIMEELDENSKPKNMLQIYYYGGKAIALSEYPSKDEAREEALECFRTIVEIAPNSEYGKYARARINEIEAGKTIKH